MHFLPDRLELHAHRHRVVEPLELRQLERLHLLAHDNGCCCCSRPRRPRRRSRLWVGWTPWSDAARPTSSSSHSVVAAADIEGRLALASPTPATAVVAVTAAVVTVATSSAAVVRERGGAVRRRAPSQGAAARGSPTVAVRLAALMAGCRSSPWLSKPPAPHRLLTPEEGYQTRW
ncbi:hypothetical protein PF003_g23843 [Phytophthora fragariae]|nr:hypothetical protein PF003_g23843 [Phytophthora fragariae]